MPSRRFEQPLSSGQKLMNASVGSKAHLRQVQDGRAEVQRRCHHCDGDAKGHQPYPAIAGLVEPREACEATSVGSVLMARSMLFPGPQCGSRRTSAICEHTLVQAAGLL